MSGLFAGKKGLITGVFNKQSIAWAIAEQVMEQGGDCGFTHMPDKPDDERRKNQGRVEKLIDGNPRAKFLVPMDVTNDEHVASVAEKCKSEFGNIDFLLHSIAFAPPEDLKKDTVDTSREGFKLAMAISVHSLMALSSAHKDLLSPGSSILTLTYFGGEKAVPGYNVMGVCKAALDATVRYLAYDLGPRDIRVNALSAGPVQTISGRGAGVDEMLGLYEAMAPLGRNITHEEVGKSGVYLLSDMSSGVTGEILHVDAGYNAMGSPGRLLDKFKAAKG
ncbi:enoyl-ACP reductase FabI [Botrimarina mediterranea]|uniref:Enoyl-[acyl-carrier-protein] reductase [NADH] n=1 Tax=Botrimarina mediterranea TaxID=2528022 RepID=A0A518KC38_9BACT|nr:enoyl-ACP reductase [Botrimarina mediterranea]QDV75362.1 Enoyl-[acyl-carrier-protein] reductase [NADH] FabI [Botrimarina mediterranea]QDV80032.1 Enoyl-[acyl-carrier-protein] reductase [NADH] FabI [Planctomycetes bacterium K2D]